MTGAQAMLRLRSGYAQPASQRARVPSYASGGERAGGGKAQGVLAATPQRRMDARDGLPNAFQDAKTGTLERHQASSLSRQPAGSATAQACGSPANKGVRMRRSRAVAKRQGDAYKTARLGLV